MALESINGLQRRDVATTTGDGGLVLSHNFGKISNYYSYYNLVENPRFNLAQRQAYGTQSNYSDAQYCADCWIALSQTGTVGYNRGTSSSYSAAGSTPNVTTCGVIANTSGSSQRWGIHQLIHNPITQLRGRQVRFQAKVAGTLGSTTNIKYAILEHRSDALSRDPVNDWTSSTYTTGNFFKSSNLAVISVGTQSVSSTPTWYDISTEGVVSTSATGLSIFVWTESSIATTQSFALTEVILMQSYSELAASGTIPFLVDPMETARAMRFYQRSIPVGSGYTDTSIGSNSVTLAGSVCAWIPFGVQNGRTWANVQFPYRMYEDSTGIVATTRPIVTGGNTGRVSNGAGTVDLFATSAATVRYVTAGGFEVYNNSGYILMTDDHQIRFHWYAYYELGS